MSLKGRQTFTTQSQQQGEQGFETPKRGTVSDAVRLDPPAHAQVDNEPVRAIMIGNVTGFSPGYLCVDAEGNSAWVALKDAKITDPHYLPITRN